MADIRNFYSEDDQKNSFEAIPEGRYLAVIRETAMKPTKAGGEYLEIKFEIVDGPYRSINVFARLNLNNQNATAVKIARGDFAAIREATGVLKPADSVELHNIPLEIKVVCVKGEYNGHETIKNEIKGYYRRGTAPVAEQQAASEATNPATAGGWNPN